MLPRLALLLFFPAVLLAQDGRINQARNFNLPDNTVREQHDTAETGLSTTPAASDDESFGVQQILKRQEREESFRTFAEISAFVTNNVALTRRDHISDSFLIATFGMEYRKALVPGLQFDASVRGALFRYNRVSALNFVSVDVAAQLSYHAERLWNLGFSLGYDYTNLINDRVGDSFFENHAIIAGVQKNFQLSRAHYLFTGASATFGFADPRIEQRDEYGAYAGYHLQLTRHLETELVYRYAFYDYAERGREDHNQTLSLSARYAVANYLTVFASAFGGVNRSNYSVFDYDVGNLGLGLGLSIRY